MLSEAGVNGYEHASPWLLPSPAKPNAICLLAQTLLAFLGSVLGHQTPPRAIAALNTTTPPHAAFYMVAPYDPTNPTTTNIDSPVRSRPVSSGSSTIAGEKPKEHTPRTKTSYIIAHPPPTTHPHSKLHFRPKVQLQLRQSLAAQRPKPVYEIIPFSLLTPRSTRRLARAFNGREHLSHGDLLIVKAAAYSQADDNECDDECWGSRKVIAVIYPGKTERGHVITHTEICMDDGTSRWRVVPLLGGGFEFNTFDKHGLPLRARWVARLPKPRRHSGVSVRSQPLLGLSVKDDAQWSFSIISTSSRRHPVIASMTPTRISVQDSYVMPAITQLATPGAHVPASPAFTPTSIETDSFIDATCSFAITTDDALRRFILVSGVWVSSLQEDFEQAALPRCFPFHVSDHSRSAVYRKTTTSFLDSARLSSSPSMHEARKSIPRLLRNSTQRLSRNACLTDSPASSTSAQTAPSFPEPKDHTHRANLTDTHRMHNVTDSIKKRLRHLFSRSTAPGNRGG